MFLKCSSGIKRIMKLGKVDDAMVVVNGGL